MHKFNEIERDARIGIIIIERIHLNNMGLVV